jgi:hypothetical protein
MGWEEPSSSTVSETSKSRTWWEYRSQWRSNTLHPWVVRQNKVGGFVFASSSKIELRAPLSLTFDGCHAAIAGGALVLPTGVLLTSSYGLSNRTSLIMIQNCSAGLFAGGLLMGCPRIEAALQFAFSFDHSLIAAVCTCRATPAHAASVLMSRLLFRAT